MSKKEKGYFPIIGIGGIAGGLLIALLIGVFSFPEPWTAEKAMQKIKECQSQGLGYKVNYIRLKKEFGGGRVIRNVYCTLPEKAIE